MRRTALALLMAGLLPACAEIDDLRQTAPPEVRPAAPAPPPPVRSRESLAQEAFYARAERALLARGLLRDDGGGPDAPFTDAMVARNFNDLVFSEEFSEIGGFIAAAERTSTLHRWTEPISVEIIFGETVERTVQRSDLDIATSYIARLSRITGHPMSVTRARGDFTIFVLHEQDIGRIGPELRQRLPGISRAEIAFVETLPLEAYCLVFTSDPGNDGQITAGVAIIRAELPDALRTACYHEELAQGMGLANDSDLARPSIFNDDDEFGRLTTHDEVLLSLLYDARLRPGMTETDAAPIVRALARARLAPAT